jgi:serine/threonine protein kinase/WD40 repeat protein
MLSPESREDWIVREALKRPLAERSTFLDGACTGDAALRGRIEALLARGQAVASPAADPETERENSKVSLSGGSDEAVGQTLGRYKLLEKIGEGGFGTVYVAEQKEPVKRRVALKIIKLGMDTRQVVARFEAERQALALMDHPNIARVLDAGATESGRPFFVMELVRGVKLTEYCDQNKLSTRQRLELFIPICQAIQHAHQKGIIHRDIKPSNILVTLHDGVPVPKVIDFGIAKATQQDLTDKTVYTQLQQFIGTPAYMSPEQAEMSGLDVDTRSDIYSLGVLLYELLTGGTPFDAKELMAQGIDAMRKTIREKEPPRPSTRVATLQGEELTTTAARHAIEAPRLISLLRGDLDWIVMKCLEKDRTRRYETANGVAMDIKRHLNNETVTARPPSKLYEFQKTFRRHKVGFIATGSVIAALVVGVALSTWQAARAIRAKRDEAVQRQKAVEATASEARLREQAQAQELAARQRAYASDMNVAVQALAGSNLGRTLELLNRQRPVAGQKDLRGWEWRYLWEQTRSDALFTLCQKSEISSLAVSTDGRWLAIGSVHRDGVFVWDLNTRQELAHLSAGEGMVRVAFSPAEPLMAFTCETLPTTGVTQDALTLWNVAERRTIARFPLDGRAAGLRFSNDGKTLAVSTLGGRVTLWRVPAGTQLASYPSEQYGLTPATSFAVTADLGLAGYGTPRGELCVLDLRTGKELWRAQGSKQYITALAFSPDGKTLASGAGFGESGIRLWDAASGKDIGQLDGHKSWVGSLVFWPDGKRLASSSADQTIRIWDVPARKSLTVLRGHLLEVWRLALLPDNRTLISGSKDGSVCVWDTSRTLPVRGRITLPGNFSAFRFTPDSRSILTVETAGKVRHWSGPDLQVEELLFTTATNVAGAAPCFSRDGRLLAIASAAGGIEVWDLIRRSRVRELKFGGAPRAPLAFGNGGSRLFMFASDVNQLSEWDLEGNQQTQAWPAPTGFEQLVVSPDEQLAVAVGWEGDVLSRDLRTKSTTELPLGALEGWNLAFQANGKRMAIGSAQGFARIWNTGTWREEATLRGFLNAVDAVAFSPDGKRLATSGSNPEDTIKLWDVESWQELLTLEGSGSEILATSFSPDSNSIGTLKSEGTIQIWRAPSWEEVEAAEARQKGAGVGL